MISSYHKLSRTFRSGQLSFVTGLNCHILIDHFVVAIKGFRNKNIIDLLLMITDDITIKITIVVRDIVLLLSFKFDLVQIFINIKFNRLLPLLMFLVRYVQ